MKKLSLVLVFLIVLESLCLTVGSVFATDIAMQGSGTEESPYLIGTEAELIAFREKVNGGEISAYATLTSDIALTSKWTPIGTADNKYSGVFDGNGHKITNVRGNGNSEEYWGFFAYTNGGEIKNLTISTGTDSVTAIGHQSALLVAISSNKTKISKCAGYGNITGRGHIGGITYIGECIVENCYYIGDISGAHNVSGMGMDAVATNCFVYGNIKATTSAFKVANGSGTDREKNFYLSVEGTNTVGYGTQKNASAFTGGEVAYLLGEAFGQKIGVDNHPVFKTDDNTVYFVNNISYTNNNSEDGSPEKPYTIASEASLVAFRNAVNAGSTSLNAKLASDITLTSNWTPIGTAEKQYSGTFDGNGFEISNVKGSGNAWGFFAYTDGAIIKNLTLKTATDGTGDLGNQSALFVARGSDDTEIINCAGYGKVYSSWAWVGGISYDGKCKVTNCYFIGDVEGVHNVTAMGFDAVATNCFIYGTVKATQTYAFRISNNSATSNCYFLNAVAVAVDGVGGYGTQKNAEAFASGEVALLLGDAFGQTIGVDKCPVFKTADNIVYKTAIGTYTNDNTENGSAEKPYTIASEASLIAFKNAVNTGSTSLNAKLVSDIALTSNWTPIGTAENQYAGTFDGNGFEISNVKGSGSPWGFFAYTNGGEIKNLTISRGSDPAIGHQSALFVAMASNDTKITNCAGYGDLSGYGYIGGITYDGACIVENCYYVGNISGAHMVSAMGNGSVAKNCFIYGTVNATTNCNKISNKQATNCYFLNAEGANVVGYGTQKSAEAFASGEVTYLINKNAGEIIYGQNIGTETYPVAESDAVVYKKLDGTYSNEEGTFVGINNSQAMIVSATDALAFIAQYGENGILVIANPITLKAGVMFETEIVSEAGATNAKIFVWDSLTSIRPIANVEPYSFQ